MSGHELKQCGRCGGPIEARDIGGIQADFCTRCESVTLARRDLALLAEDAPGPSEPAPLRGEDSQTILPVDEEPAGGPRSRARAKRRLFARGDLGLPTTIPPAKRYTSRPPTPGPTTPHYVSTPPPVRRRSHEQPQSGNDAPLPGGPPVFTGAGTVRPVTAPPADPRGADHPTPSVLDAPDPGRLPRTIERNEPALPDDSAFREANDLDDPVPFDPDPPITEDLVEDPTEEAFFNGSEDVLGDFEYDEERYEDDVDWPGRRRPARWIAWAAVGVFGVILTVAIVVLVVPTLRGSRLSGPEQVETENLSSVLAPPDDATEAQDEDVVPAGDDEVPDEVPAEAPDEVPDEVPAEAPDEVPDEVPAEVPDEVPDASPPTGTSGPDTTTTSGTSSWIPEPPVAPPTTQPASPSLRALVSQGWDQVSSDASGAASTFQRALEIDPADPEANYGYGYALLQKGQATAARTYLCAALPGGDVDIQREVSGLLSRNELSCD